MRLRAPVAIVGAGPVGLTAAIDLALQGVACILLDDRDDVHCGSRAICWAKRTLEIFDRLGVGERVVEQGVTWQVGRVFKGAEELYRFDLLPEPGHRRPAFVNLQQDRVERILAERCRELSDRIDFRRRHRVMSLCRHPDRVVLAAELPDGRAEIEAGYVLACDGARSTSRDLLGLRLRGAQFEERFLIADVEMQAEFPNERWFWFHPPFHPGQTALLHKQPEGIYRIDLQLGEDADPEAERAPERVIPRIRKAVEGRPFRLDWASVYRFRCARLDRFRAGRVFFLGDSAHLVSPFGARGGNGGIHDADNLCWKLAARLRGEAGPALLDSYDEERGHGADENLRHSARTSRFMSPSGEVEGMFRDEALRLASRHAFARPLVNSGRLSAPAALRGMSRVTPTDAPLPLQPGDPCPDAPLPDGKWLLDRVGGRFLLLDLCGKAPDTELPVLRLRPEGSLLDRYGPGVFLLRPDQHVAAAWLDPGSDDLRAALARAQGWGACKR